MRLKTQVMYRFELKYPLCLHDVIERRIGLEYKQKEEFTVEELRGLLNVPDGKLERFADVNRYGLKVKVEEINKLFPIYVDFTPIKKNRKVENVARSRRAPTVSNDQVRSSTVASSYLNDIFND